MDLKNQTELELYFADHFDTVLFPVLGELYLSQGDYGRAKKVCEIGLEHGPENVEGQFILAKAELGLGNLPRAEKLMKNVLNAVPDHLSAAVTLPMLQEQLDRAETTLDASWKRALALDPENQLARDYLSREKTRKKKVKTGPSSPKKKTGKNPGKELILEGMRITPRLATFTFVAVLRNQGLFHQALDVLDLIEEKGGDPKRIAQERQAVKADIQP